MSTFATWLQTFFQHAKPASKVEIIRRFASSLRLSEWQANADTVKIAAKLLGDPEFRMVLDVLNNEHPAKLYLELGKFRNCDRAVMQARIEGYQMCLNNIEAMGTLQVPRPQLQETFSDPLHETQE